MGGDGASIEVRRENLAPALRLVAEVLREPAFSPQEFEEMKRAALTGAESQRTDPSAQASLQLARHLALYPKGHPYSWSVIGSMADLSAASLEDTKNFFRQYYAPNNAVLTVAGYTRS